MARHQEESATNQVFDRRGFIQGTAASLIAGGAAALFWAEPASAAGLNRAKAREYALKNWDHYPFGVSRSEDCTGFVSRCLSYGGLPNATGVGGPWKPGSVAWVRTSDFVTFMINKRWATIHRAPLTSNRLPHVKVGDVIHYCWNNSPNPKNQHLAIVTRVSSSHTYVTQHSKSVKERRWNYRSDGSAIRSPHTAAVLRYKW